MPFVYIVECSDGTLYTDSAEDLDKKLAQHNAGKGAKYTKARIPVILRYKEEIPNWGTALRREREIKKLPRNKKMSLLEFKI